MAINESRSKPSSRAAILACLQDDRAQTTPGPVRTHEHGPDARRLGRGVEQARPSLLVGRTTEQLVATTPAAAGDEFPCLLHEEVGAILQQLVVRTSDVLDARPGLLLVVERREDPADGGPHERLDGPAVIAACDPQSHVPGQGGIR